MVKVRSTGLQLHATPAELLELAEKWALDHDLSVALERFLPDRKVVVATDRVLAGVTRQLGRVNRLVLAIDGLTLPTSARADVGSLNPDCLTVTIGDLENNCLRVSAIAAYPDNAHAGRIWSSVVRQFKRTLSHGAWVKNPATGATGFYPHHYFTPGAKRLQSEGVTMLAIAGWGEYELTGPLESDDPS